MTPALIQWYWPGDKIFITSNRRQNVIKQIDATRDKNLQPCATIWSVENCTEGFSFLGCESGPKLLTFVIGGWKGDKFELDFTFDQTLLCFEVNK